MGFFVSYVAYTAIMLVVSRKRSGRWIRPSTLGWFILSASIIGISKLAITVLDGPYWGLIPTCIIAVSCCSIYFHNLRKEKV
jgi:hypothetical protein